MSVIQGILGKRRWPRLAGARAAAVDALTLPLCGHGTGTARVVLNVRHGVGTGFPIAGQLQPGQMVDVWAVVEGWVLVQAASGLTGWCAREYLVLGELVA